MVQLGLPDAPGLPGRSVVSAGRCLVAFRDLFFKQIVANGATAAEAKLSPNGCHVTGPMNKRPWECEGERERGGGGLAGCPNRAWQCVVAAAAAAAEDYHLPGWAGSGGKGVGSLVAGCN